MTKIVSIKDAYDQAQPKEKEWPRPIPLPISLLDVAAFDRSLLPSRLGPWAEDIAERLNVPLDFTAMPTIVAAGSLIGAKVGVRPQRHTSWTEAANLFGCIVGSPGMMKSPAVGEVFSPLRRLDAAANQSYEAELSFFEDAQLVDKIVRDETQRRVRKAVKDGDIEAAHEIVAEHATPKPPVARRYLLTDATVEKLGEICSENPDGILFYRDELLTLLSDLDHPEKAVARGFFLTGWNGQDFYAFDRIGRGTIRIPRVNLSMFGTTQPTRIANYVRRCLSDKNDGMIQRLQLLAWPDVTNEWADVDRYPHQKAKDDAFGCFEALAQLSPHRDDFDRELLDDGSGMPFLRFSGEAVDEFKSYRSVLEQEIRNEDLTNGLSDHLSKYRGLVPRLALINHLAGDGAGEISGEAVATAIRFADYLRSHAQRVYGSMSVDNGAVARAILRRIDARDLKDGFTEKDIYSRHWTNLAKGERLTQALKMLVEYDWLEAEQVSTGGRPKTVYRINPRGRRFLMEAA